MNQIPNINVPVDSINSVIAEQRNLRQDIDANNKERCELKRYVASLISVAEKHADVADASISDTSSTISTLIKTTKSVDSIHHIDLSSDEERKSLTADEFATMSADGRISVTDELLKELYVANTRIDANIKVGTELQERWSELESTVTGIKKDLEKFIKELNDLKQYFKIDNLLFHNFRLPFGTLSSREFVGYMVRQINILLPNLPVTVHANHISTAHPLSTKAKKSNVVVVRFCNRHIKDMIYEARDSVGYGVSITEHLTDHTQGIVKKAESLFGRRNVYTESTKVFVNCNGKCIRIFSKDEANKVFVQFCERIGSSSSNYPIVEPTAYPSSYRGSYNYSSSYISSNFSSVPNFNSVPRINSQRPSNYYKSKTYGNRSTGYSVYNRPY